MKFKLPLILLTFFLTAPAPAARAASAAAPDTLAAGDTLYVADRPLIEALTIIQREFLQDMSREQLVDRALRALLKDLDPYSQYLDRQEWAEMSARLEAQFAGLGVMLGIDAATQLPVIQNLMIGSAAGAAGIRPGDLITNVDGRSLKGLSMDEITSRLIGPPDTELEVTVDRRDGNAPGALRIRRRIIKTPSVRGIRRTAAGESDYVYDASRSIGYIRISRLAEDTVPEVERALAGLKRRRMKGLILDLRSSSGGLMQSAIGVADLFLDKGRILANVSRRDTTTYDAKPGGHLDFPIVVLIDSWTASSSEFLAAALKDNRRALFLGQRTYGKSRIQRRYPLSHDRGGLTLTTGKFESPSGKSLDRHDAAQGAGGDSAGVVPDSGLEVLVAGKEYDTWADDVSFRDSPALPNGPAPAALPSDRMLDRAVQVLEEAMRRGTGIGRR